MMQSLSLKTILAILLLTAFAGTAAAKTPTLHRVHLTGATQTLFSTGTPGTPGVRDTDAGLLNGTIAGAPRWHGALRLVGTWGKALSIAGTGTAYDASGTFDFRLQGKFTPTPVRGIVLNATVRVMRGTGLYRGASGTLRATGIASVTSGTTRSTLTLTGRLRFPSR